MSPWQTTLRRLLESRRPCRINYPEFSLMHDEQFGSLENFDYAAVAFPFGSNDTTGATVADQDGTSRPVGIITRRHSASV